MLELPDKQVSPPGRVSRRARLTKSRAVSSSSLTSSSDDDDDARGSRSHLVPASSSSRLKSAKPRSKSIPSSAKPQQSEEPKQPQPQVSKESSIARSIKRRFAFFRSKSENIKPDVDVEAADPPPTNRMDVVVDVHAENEARKVTVGSKSPSKKSDDEGGLEMIEELESSDQDRVPPTSGRKRWDKSEVAAEDLVEDLTKPRRRQWTEGSSSAEIRDTTGKKILVPKRSATAEPLKHLGDDKQFKQPIAAPRRLKSLSKPEDKKGVENDGFSSDHDEVLRIETVNNRSPKIKMSSSVEIEKIEDLTSALSEDDKPSEKSNPSIVMIKEYKPKSDESSEDSDSSSLSGSRELLNVPTKKIVSKRPSRRKRKTSTDRPDDEDEDEDEEEQETVLDAMDRKSRRSSSSSKIEKIPANFFKRKSSDETTISTNEDMRLSRRESRISRPKSKASRRERSDDNASSRSSKRKTSSSTRNSAEEVLTKQRSKKKKRQKKKEKHKMLDEEEDTKYVSVRVHRSDMLEADYVTRHPMVKVHIMNADTGEYAKHVDDGGPLMPIVTQKFDFKEKMSMVPVWEEELVFEMSYADLVAEGKSSVVVLFEIVDLVNLSEASECYDQVARDACWHKVAWAFLRPIGLSGVHHVGKKVRLQLYRPKRSFRKSKLTKNEVFKWWKSNNRDKYPASLFVSVLAIEPPKVESMVFEQTLQLNESENQSAKTTEEQPQQQPQPQESAPKWTRHAAQSCQIPNESYMETEAGDNGCFFLAFSNNGKYLACVLAEEYDYPILVYKIDEGKIHVRFTGHKNFVYSLSWSQDDRYLLSVSSDQTARFWDVRERIIEYVQSLPHPSYVYCGKFFPEAPHYIVTGCYDHVARVWARLRPSRSRQYELVQELEAHESFVNAVCIQPKVETCLTGDGLGVIVVWLVRKSKRSPIKREWTIARKIKIRELEGVPINTILMHPMGSRMLVHSRNNGLRLLDLASGVVVRKFEGLKNHRIQVTACISPCGSLLFCGNEDSSLNVWNVDNGKLLATYEIDRLEKAVSCVDYHPYDHVMAFTIFGSPVPVKILRYDRDADGTNVGLKLHNVTTSLMSVNSMTRMKDPQQPPIVRNGVRHLEVPFGRSQNSSSNISQVGSIANLLNEYKDDSESRRYAKGKLQKFIVESGPNLKTKSMNRLNGIIEKIDRILMYATSQKSPGVDIESGPNPSIFTIDDRLAQEPARNLEIFELQEMPSEKAKAEMRTKKQRHRSRSARNACSPTPKEAENSKAFSDSAAFIHKVSRFSDDSNSNSTVHDKFVVEKLEMKKVEYPDTESGFKDSLDTIVDGKEDFPSEENLDVESLKSDDTYIVEKKDGSSDRSNATFVIDSEVSGLKMEKSNLTFTIRNEVPVPKPRRRSGRIEVM